VAYKLGGLLVRVTCPSFSIYQVFIGIDEDLPEPAAVLRISSLNDDKPIVNFSWIKS